MLRATAWWKDAAIAGCAASFLRSCAASTLSTSQRSLAVTVALRRRVVDQAEFAEVAARAEHYDVGIGAGLRHARAARAQQKRPSEA
jgi:hypothetical protein